MLARCAVSCAPADRSSHIEDQERWLAVRLRTLSSFAVAAVLGAGIAVLPALAASESVTIKVTEDAACPYKYGPAYPCWTPETATITSGGTVKFVNESSTVEQEVRWTGALAPVCEGVPSTPEKGPWEGSCKFTQPGTYSFEGAKAYSSGKVIVTGTSSTTPTTTSTSTSTTGSTTPSTTGSGNAPGGSGSTPGSSTPTGSAGAGASPLGSLFVGSASSAVRVASVQHGHSVRGSVDVSQASSGGQLEVQLLAARASLAGVGHSARVPVGRAVRSSLHAGKVAFTVSLDAKARRALHAHGRLALSVKLVLSPTQGAVVTVTRSVVLRG